MLFRVFAENVGRYLDAVDRLATSPATRQACGPLGAELRRLAGAWRVLLEAHQPTGPRGRCSGCGPRPGALRSRRAMCGVWKVANAYFTRRVERE